MQQQRERERARARAVTSASRNAAQFSARFATALRERTRRRGAMQCDVNSLACWCTGANSTVSSSSSLSPDVVRRSPHSEPVRFIEYVAATCTDAVPVDGGGVRLSLRFMPMISTGYAHTPHPTYPHHYDAVWPGTHEDDWIQKIAQRIVVRFALTRRRANATNDAKSTLALDSVALARTEPATAAARDEADSTTNYIDIVGAPVMKRIAANACCVDVTVSMSAKCFS